MACSVSERGTGSRSLLVITPDARRPAHKYVSDLPIGRDERRYGNCSTAQNMQLFLAPIVEGEIGGPNIGRSEGGTNGRSNHGTLYSGTGTRYNEVGSQTCHPGAGGAR